MRRADRLRRVSLRLFDTATRELRDFTPREAGKVGMYICGLTTQGAPHIGHIRFAVAFDVRSWASYGALTRQSLDAMEPAEDADPRGKRDPRDFALWKGHKSDEPESASWPTPFGAGRPGWHLECSAMARRWLGDEFDIHGGGIDLRFPHHENEQAQSRAAGLGFARYWLHNAWVTVKGQKMGKSLGNALEVRHLLEATRPIVLRYYLTAAHYRSMIEYHPGSLEEAAAAVERIEGFLERAARRGTIVPLAAAALPAAFVASMDDDLGVSGALAVVHDTVRAGNSALDEDDDEAALEAAAAVVAMTEVLGINPLAAHWGSGGSREEAAAELALEALVRAQLDARQVARQERDFERADQIRDTLTAVGIEITDTPSGAQWSLARPARGDAETATDTTTDHPTAAPRAEKAQG